MIVALLVVIVLILLFGAAAVKGWIANVVGFACGGVAILIALLWLGSFFGQDGVRYVLWTTMGLMLLLALLGMAFAPKKPDLPPSTRPRARPLRKHAALAPRAPSPQQQKAREKALDKVWSRYADDILLRFSSEARAEAHELYRKNDVLRLGRLCRQEVIRLKK
ncbi:MAG TPA: hypothetical protein VGB59_07870 [Allosphingosinicella sp.]